MKRIVPIVTLWLFIPFCAHSADALYDYIKKGNELFTQKEYQEALKKYSDAALEAQEHNVVQYNKGITFYELQKYEEAKKELEKSQSLTSDRETKGKIDYNLGNLAYRNNQLEDAVQHYIQALKQNPEDQDAKFNLEFVRKKIKDQIKPQQQQQQNQQPDAAGVQMGVYLIKPQQQQQQNQQNQEKQQDQKDQQDQQNQQNQQDQEKQQQQQQEKDQQQKENEQAQETQSQQEQQEKMDQQQAEAMLKAMEDQEKKNLEKMRVPAGGRRHVEKDW